MIRTGAVGRSAKEKGPRRGPFGLAGMLQNPVQATPPRVLVPIPSTTVLATLDSASVQLRPNPAFPVTLPLGVAPRTAEPSCSRMPSPEPGTVAVLFWIVLFLIWAEDLKVRITPKPTLLLITASRMLSADPRKPEMPPVEFGLPFPVMVLTVDMSKLVSPRFAEPLFTLTPAPTLPEMVLSPMRSALALVMLIPFPLNPTEGLVPLPVMPFAALALIALPPATLELSMPMRAAPPVDTVIPIRAFWLICELITVPLAP